MARAYAVRAQGGEEVGCVLDCDVVVLSGVVALWGGTTDVPGSMAGGVIRGGARIVQDCWLGGRNCGNSPSGIQSRRDRSGRGLKRSTHLCLSYQVAWIVGISFEASQRLVGYSRKLKYVVRCAIFFLAWAVTTVSWMIRVVLRPSRLCRLLHNNLQNQRDSQPRPC